MTISTVARLLYAAMVSAKVTDMYRYPVKGLSGDPLDQVIISQSGETFPDDRRFALLQRANKDKWVGDNWLHKENFLCAFTAPELLAQYRSSYQILSSKEGISRGVPSDSPTGTATTSSETTQRLLKLIHRSTGQSLLGPVDLAQEKGRQELARFLSEESGQDVTCITSSNAGDTHKHQFGNTSSGVKQRGDTRTVHIINRATIQDLSDKIGIQLNPYRFRPNIVVEDVDAWSEFDWIGNSLEAESGLKFSVISKTVRCKGVSVDPTDSAGHILDIPDLLIKNFPEHGPYFGVYAVVDERGSLTIGAELRLMSK